MNVSNDSISTTNAITTNATAYMPPSPPIVTQHDSGPTIGVHNGGFTMAENTAIALLASSAIGSILGLIVVTSVLVCVTKQLARLVAVLRGETSSNGGTSVHTALLAGTNLAPAPDAFAGPGTEGLPTPTATPPDGGGGGGGGGGSGGKNGNGKSILKRPTPRLAAAAASSSSSGLTRHEKARRARPDNGGTSCAIPEAEDEDEAL